MEKQNIMGKAVEIAADDDVMASSNQHFRLVAERAPTNAVLIASLIIDAVATVTSIANTAEELAAVTDLIQDATADTIARRLMLIAARSATSQKAAEAGVTVH